MDIQNKIPRIIIIILTLYFFVSIIYMSFNPYMGRDISTFNDNWYIKKDNDEKLLISIPGQIDNLDILKEYTIKKDISKNENTIMFVLEYASLVATIDDIEIGRWGFNKGVFAMPGRRLITIDLNDYSGEILELTFVKYTNNYLESFYIGSTSDLILYCIYSSFPMIVLSITLIILGIFLIYVYFIDRDVTINKYSNLFLSIFVIIVGLYLPGRTLFIYTLLSPGQIMIVYMIVQFLLPVSILVFALSICSKAKSFIKSALIIHSICYPIISLNQMFNMSANIYILMIFQYLHLLYYILAFIAIIIEVKNENTQLRRMGFGLLILVLGYLLDMFIIRTTPHVDTFFFKISLVIFIVVQCIDRIILFIKHSSDMEVRLKTADYKAKILLDDFEKSSEHIEEIRLIKHDINSHFNTIRSMLEDENIDRAKQYIEDIRKTKVLKTPISICNVPIVDAIVNNSICQAKDKNITFDYGFNINKKIEIDDNDLCSLLTNILDNAIEACSGFDDSWIKLDCHFKNNLFCICCKNSINKPIIKKNKKYKSNKADKIEHGYGIRIINKVVKKYNGIINIYNDEKVFSVEIAI